MKLSFSSFALATLATASVSVEAASNSNYFTYFERGGFGPSNWAFLDDPTGSNQCGGTGGESGYGQSPVVISAGTPGRCDSGMEDYSFQANTCTYEELEFTISNTGLKVSPKKDSSCDFGSMSIAHNPNTFSAQELVIHLSSEHKIMGQGIRKEGSFPAELQILHTEDAPVNSTSSGGAHAMLGAMIDINKKEQPNPKFEYLLQGWEAAAQVVEDSCPYEVTIDEKDGEEKVVAVADEVIFKPVQRLLECPAIGSRLLPFATSPEYPEGESPDLYDLPIDSDYGVYTYKGGLTTPSCTESVDWNIADSPIMITQNQMDRLYALILCSVTKNYRNVLDANSTWVPEVSSCSHGTVAAEDGSTTRPTQPLNGRFVFHRCRETPLSHVMFAPTLIDMGEVNEAETTFAKPLPKPEPSNTNNEERKCDSWMYTDCSTDPRFDQAVSPNLKAATPAWADAEGFWYGTLSSYGSNGLPVFERFTSDTIPNALPYRRDEVMVFVNRTISETRYYEHVTYMYHPASEEFCTIPVPDGAMNVIGDGYCGVNGFVQFGEKFGVATFEKDGNVKMIYGNGHFDGTTIGAASVIDDTAFYSSVGSEENGFSISETTTYINEDLTRVAGSGKYFIFADTPPYSTNPLAESYTFDLQQTSEDAWKKMYEEQLDEINLRKEMRNQLMNEEVDPTLEELYAQYDPLLAENPYQEETGVKTEFIIIVCVAAFVLAAIAAYLTHRYYVLQQELRYKQKFAMRVAETIRFNGGHDDLTPKALEEEFMRMDADGNGTLDKKEMRAFMGDKIDHDDFEAMFAAMDVDGNGTVEFAEFCSFLSNMGKAFDRANGGKTNYAAQAQANANANGSTASPETAVASASLDDGTSVEKEEKEFVWDGAYEGSEQSA